MLSSIPSVNDTRKKVSSVPSPLLSSLDIVGLDIAVRSARTEIEILCWRRARLKFAPISFCALCTGRGVAVFILYVPFVLLICKRLHVSVAFARDFLQTHAVFFYIKERYLYDSLA